MGVRRNFACLVVGIIAMLAPVSAAQTTDRAQVMNRIVDGINSPDPVTRMLTLERAMATKDKNLQRMALAAAFASSDLALRTAAIEAVFSLKTTFSVEFTGMMPGTKDARFIEKSGGRLDIWVRGFDANTGNFQAHSNFSYWNNITKDYTLSPGNLSGDRLSLSVNVYKLGSGGASCTGSVVAKDASTLMTGTLICESGSLEAAYTVQVDLLR